MLVARLRCDTIRAMLSYPMKKLLQKMIETLFGGAGIIYKVQRERERDLSGHQVTMWFDGPIKQLLAQCAIDTCIGRLIINNVCGEVLCRWTLDQTNINGCTTDEHTQRYIGINRGCNA